MSISFILSILATWLDYGIFENINSLMSEFKTVNSIYFQFILFYFNFLEIEAKI